MVNKERFRWLIPTWNRWTIIILTPCSSHFHKYINMWKVNDCIITQVILVFWLVVAYDLLEDRHTIEVIVTTFFPPCFKMAESFENLDNILRDWAKDKGQKSLAEALNRFEKQEEER